jgi:hypothetical protein
MRLTFGTTSCRSSIRFAASCPPPKNVTPVRLPPGRWRFETRPDWTGSPPATNTIGTDDGSGLGRGRRTLVADNHSHLALDQVRHETWQSTILVVRVAILDRNVLAFDEASLLQAGTECGDEMTKGLGRTAP